MLKRWAIAFGQLGLILLVVGVAPALAMSIFAPTANAMIPVLLSLTVAPLGALSLLAAAVMWITAKLRD